MSIIEVKEAPVFQPLTKVNTATATPYEEIIEKIKVNIKKPYLRLHQLPEFRKVKGADVPIAIVGGGPSVANYIDEIKKFRTIIACGSAHDYLRQQGIVPSYCTVCDPDPISADYLNLAHPETKFLISTGCDEKVFEVLKDKPIVMWHCHSDEYSEELAKLEKDYQAVGGGCTVGLRSISIAILLGYSNLHLFGFDSCLGIDDTHHAYGFATDKEEIGQIYEIKLGLIEDNKPLENSKTYRCAGYQIAQAEHFKEFYLNYGQYFKPKFYGEGLLPHMYALIKLEEQKALKRQRCDNE